MRPKQIDSPVSLWQKEFRQWIASCSELEKKHAEIEEKRTELEAKKQEMLRRLG